MGAMLRFTLFVCASGVIGNNAACCLPAQTLRPVDVLVEDAAAGFMVGNLAEFNRKLTATISKAWFTLPEDTLTDVFYSALGPVEIDHAVDRSGIGGVMFFGDFSTVTWLYPVRDVTPIAAGFDLDARLLESGAAWECGNQIVGMNNDHLFVSSSMFQRRDITGPGRRIDNPLAGRQSIGELAGFEDHEMFGTCDAVALLGGQRTSAFWGDLPGRLFGPRGVANLAGMDDPGDRETWDRIRQASQEFRFGLAAINLDDGLHVQTKTFFDDTPDSAARKLIEELRAGQQASNLNHLPDAQMLIAMAAAGEGNQNVLVARSLLRLVVDHFSPDQEVLNGDERREFCEVFAKIWKQLTGVRMALYRNDGGDIGSDGELAMVAILDTKDAVQVMEKLPGLVEIAQRAIRRRVAAGQSPALRFEYQTAAQSMQDLNVDILQIDTTRLASPTSRRLVQFFGSSAGQIRLVATEAHVVMFWGSNPALLESTIHNLRNDQTGLAAHPAVVAAAGKLDPRKKIEMHLSAKNLNSIFSAMIRHRPDLGKYEPPTELTSLGLVMESDRFGFDVWIPDRELNRGVKLLMRIAMD